MVRRDGLLAPASWSWLTSVKSLFDGSSSRSCLFNVYLLSLCSFLFSYLTCPMFSVVASYKDLNFDPIFDRKDVSSSLAFSFVRMFY